MTANDLKKQLLICKKDIKRIFKRRNELIEIYINSQSHFKIGDIIEVNLYDTLDKYYIVYGEITNITLSTKNAAHNYHDANSILVLCYSYKVINVIDDCDKTTLIKLLNRNHYFLENTKVKLVNKND